MPAATSVEAYLERHDAWRDTLNALRALLLAEGFAEGIKWGAPTYMLDGRNLVTLGAFREHCGVWFHQGALLSDPHGVLANAQEGKTRGMRHWRLVRGGEEALRDAADPPLEALRTYLHEVRAHHEAGRRVPRRPASTRTEPALPHELADAMASDHALRESWATLTPGRRRAYAEHIRTAKRAATRARRLAKALPLIRAGRGLNDRYR